MYDGLAIRAAALIAKYGRTMYLRSYTATGDEWNPTLVAIDTEIKGVMLEYTAYEQNDLIQANDKKVLVSAEVEPTPQHKLVDGGIEYEIVRAKPLKPGVTLILTELQIRK
jgi:hypothetical protein